MATEKEIQLLFMEPPGFALSQCPMPNAVVTIDSGINADCMIIMDYNGKFFEVRLLIEAPEGFIERGYLERLNSSLKL